MEYILYSPAHEMVREAFTRTTNNEYVPKKVFQCGPRAIYRHKMFERLYRRDFPGWDDKLYLLTFKTIEEAKHVQEITKDYCGELFEIREYENGKLGPCVEQREGHDG